MEKYAHSFTNVITTNQDSFRLGQVETSTLSFDEGSMMRAFVKHAADSGWHRGDNAVAETIGAG